MSKCKGDTAKIVGGLFDRAAVIFEHYNVILEDNDVIVER
jgi:hypothetical protein